MFVFYNTEEIIMKKIIALTMTLTTLPVMAVENYAAQSGVYGGVNYTYQSGIGDNSGESSNGYGLTLGGSPLKWLDLEVKSEFSTINLNDDNSTFNNFLKFDGYTATNNQLEAAAVPYYGVNNIWGLYARGAIGQNWANNLTDFTYGSIEPGVYFAPKGQKNPTRINVGYRYRGSFDNDVNYNTNSAILKGEYAFNDRDSIVGQYEYVSGDVEYNLFRIGYLARF